MIVHSGYPVVFPHLVTAIYIDMTDYISLSGMPSNLSNSVMNIELSPCIGECLSLHIAGTSHSLLYQLTLYVLTTDIYVWTHIARQLSTFGD